MNNQKLFDKYEKGQHWQNHPTEYAESFIRFLHEKKFTGNIVDIGCGNGRDVNAFILSGFKAIGVDISKKNLRLAKKEFPNCKFQNLNIEDVLTFPTWPRNSVDAFYMINVAHYLNNLSKALFNIWNLLRSEGYLYVHFNLSIVDRDYNIDYYQNKLEIMSLPEFTYFRKISEHEFTRIDENPIWHKHHILELILQKT